MPEKQVVAPSADLKNDPAFALRQEEFEQWLAQRKEALEYKFQARENELKKAFDAKVRDAVRTEMAKVDKRGRAFTKKQFMAIVHVLHKDREKAVTARRKRRRV